MDEENVMDRVLDVFLWVVALIFMVIGVVTVVSFFTR